MSIDAQGIDGAIASPATDTQPTDIQTTTAAETTTESAQPAKQEQMLPQSQVDRMMGKARKDAYAKAKADAIAEYQRTSQPTTNMGGVEQLTPERIEQMVQEATDKRAREAYANKVANDFLSKMEAGKTKYTDFEDTVNALNLPMAPEIVDWANSLDNTADVVYEIAKNPTKFTTILNLARGGFGQLAQRELQKLSASIKQNDSAKDQASAIQEPLSQIRPSTVGTDNGKMTIKDLRKQSWMRA